MACIGSAICAAGAMAGFVVVVGSQPIGEAATTPAFNVPTALALASAVLLGLGLVGLYLHQQARLTSLGTAGFVTALVGTMLAAGAAWTYVFVLPHFAAEDPALVNVGAGSVLAGFLISYAVLAIGWTIFGVATLRARSYPRGPVILLIVGALVSFLPLPSRTLILSVGAAWLGTHILGRRTSPADA